MSDPSTDTDENTNPNAADCDSIRLSVQDRYAIIAFDHHLGFTQKKIAEIIHCNPKTVSATLMRWREHYTVEDLPRSGRPPLLDITDTNNNPIVNCIRKRRKSNDHILQHQILVEHGIDLSYRTVRRLRERLGFRPVHYRRRSLLNEEQKKKTYAVCIR